ncbi:MAG: ABC transporter permease subunit [Ardenticatenales bacterium]|jgi:Cu-processing system permease protein|nr:ABC transporter permease subunit [Ardenticatenales bacterium]
MDARVIALVARKEVRDALRNRWFLLYAAGFALLAIALSQLSTGDSGTAGYAGFGRTAAGLVNLVLFVVPLMGLTLGAQSLAGERERGTLATLLAQPVTRTEVLLGKFGGLALALGAALLLGFGLAGAWVAARGGGVEAGAYAQVVAAAALLALATLSIGFLISSAARRTSTATAVALFVWLALVFAGDLGLMGSAMTMRMPVRTLLALTLLNPLEAYRIGGIAAITGGLDVLGPAGVYADRVLGASLVAVLAAVLVAWCVVPLTAAGVIFARRGIR